MFSKREPARDMQQLPIGIKRAKLRDSAWVALIIVAQTTVPLVLFYARKHDNIFRSDNATVVSHLCVFISLPLLLCGGVGLASASRLGRELDEEVISTVSLTNKQLREVQYYSGALASACVLQSVAGLVWIFEARLHARSTVLILLAIISSALLEVVAFHIISMMRNVSSFKQKNIPGGQRNPKRAHSHEEPMNF